MFLGMFDSNKYVSEMKEKFSSNGSADNVKVIDPKNIRKVQND